MTQANAFKLLHLTEAFDISESCVEDAWRKCIALVHPDRFADRSAAERRVAEQWAGRLNEAKEILLDPVRRAQEILQSAGVDIQAQTDTKMPMDFLMQQMQWRETLEQADSTEQLHELLGEIDLERHRILSALHIQIDQNRDFATARNTVRRLMFIEKIRREILRSIAQKQ